MKWFRFYHDAIDDPKVQRLPGDLFKFWVNFLCLGSQSNERGLVTLDVGEIAFALRLTDEDAESALDDLARRNLIEETVEGYQIHNWDKRQFKSDNVTERVTKHRNDQKSISVTLPETLHETLVPSVNTDTDTDTEGESGADAPTTPKPKLQRATRLPEDFTVSDEMREWARDAGATDKLITFETDKFLDYWPTVPGQKGVKLDWGKTWKNWIRRAIESAPAGSLRLVGGQSPYAGSSFDPHRRISDEERAEYDRQMVEAKRRTEEIERRLKAERERGIA